VPGQFKFPSDTSEYVAIGDAARISFINGGAQRGNPGVVLLLFALQRTQGGAYHFAGILIATAPALFAYD